MVNSDGSAKSRANAMTWKDRQHADPEICLGTITIGKELRCTAVVPIAVELAISSLIENRVTITGLNVQVMRLPDLEPRAGIEPATSSLQNWRSTN